VELAQHIVAFDVSFYSELSYISLCLISLWSCRQRFSYISVM